ncbi:hypothetical protein HMPREF1624_07700 [Sporothrix schenckii ATCC 58251]|uniref:chitinase n=1 Tax=Sporothrix schenckii (strain ATCC 58251 / de Perez 2211183) TaxID=1391915 RepID=U7PN41_SPOS1|nr:hypothetical protein HMPREF1624_07700 [Sporothrix schenckii ATCC 58251]
MLPAWLSSAAAAGLLLLSSGLISGVDARFKLRQPAAPHYKSRDGDCPISCIKAGPDPANWPVYRSVEQLSRCSETIFYHISLYDNVDKDDSHHRIFACSSFGSHKPASPAHSNKIITQVATNATFTVGHWDDNTPTNVDLRTMSAQARRFLSAGYQAANNGSRTAQPQAQVLFAQTRGSTMGLYVGKDVQNMASVVQALSTLEKTMTASNETHGTVALELCGAEYDADHVIGFVATSNSSFEAVQNVMQSWSKATCIDFNSTQTFVSPVGYTTPLTPPASTSSLNSTGSLNSTLSAAKSGLGLGARSHAHAHAHIAARSSPLLSPRADCTTVQVVYGDGCGTLATKCGISGADFTKYNPGATFCSDLKPGQHVCCSAGTLPDFAPKPNADGSCYAYTVQANDNCATIGASFDLTNDQIEGFNNDTWGWQGCGNVLLGAVICLSKGSPPFPSSLSTAVCGPQVPGTVPGPGGTFNLSGLNPCPLNACCDIWGECGITAEFCTDTSLGPPGTAKNGTYGCISNCGTDVVKGPGPANPIKIAYYEGYGMDRPCLYQDISQLSTDYTHVHFAFATLDPNTYAVSTGSTPSTYEFHNFVKLGSSFHRVLTVGGWAFSTDPSTYLIFRNGVTAANRVAMATSIANFVKQYNLDGVDIDWEYPGAPDIPGIPPASLDDGKNYLAFLAVLKNLLPGKTVSIAAPASYWYLKGFPIAEISKIVDYIVFMTYDLHGQWDTNNAYSQEGCSTGNCLRSHVNLTETMTSLAMITKAGVPSAKVVVGVTSYGRSFGMTDGSCYGPECTFGGTALESTATPGPCTNTAGYIADAEIRDIVSGTDSNSGKRAASSRINQNFYDKDSDSQITVYDGNQWVAYMTPDILASRQTLYSGLGLGGTTNWATDLETYNEVPGDMPTWDEFLLNVKAGTNPLSLAADPDSLTGNWTKLTCTNVAVYSTLNMTSEERWNELDGPDAWADVIDHWKKVDRAKGGETYLSRSISSYINGPELTNCGVLGRTSNCDSILLCNDIYPPSGPVAYELWNSIAYLHEIYGTFYDALVAAAALSFDPSYGEFENTFAPVKPADDMWISILLDVANLVGTIAVSSFFNTILKGLPFFKANGVQYDNYKDSAKALVSFAVGITGDYVTGNEGDWTAGSQTSFSAYLGQVVSIWANSTENQVAALYSGSDDTLALLTTLIAKGQMIEGDNGSGTRDGSMPDVGTSNETTGAIRSSISHGFYGYAIPAVWSAAGKGVFVLDTGADCSNLNVVSQYVDDSIQKQAMGCIDNHLYFLVYPDGPSSDSCPADGSCYDNSFSLPDGVDQMDGTKWGGVTVNDLIQGSVNTFKANGNKNGGKTASLGDDTTLNNLYDQDITTAGYIRLPVCSGDTAFWNWEEYSDRTLESWPCYVPPPKDDCQASSFIDQTSGASPSVSDCMQIVNNIINTDGEWTTQVVGKRQRALVSYGGCKFGVQATNTHGNVNFKVAASDIVDIIQESIKQFGGSGQVGAKGYMDCKGNINSQDIEWGLY